MDNANLSGSVLLHPETFRQPADVVLPLFSENTDKLLARDQEASYSLKKLAASLQNQSTVLYSPSAALLYDVLQKQSEKI
jgi:hypothetical protein